MGGINDLLNAVDIGCKRSDNDAVITVLEMADKALANHFFGRGKTGALHVGGIGTQSQNALLAQFAKASQIDDLAVDGRGVDLEVAGVNHGAHFGVDGKGHGVGDGVVYVDELHGKLACADRVACVHGDEFGGLGQAVFLQLQADQACGKAGAVDGHVDLTQNVRDCADVVLVTMGDKQTLDAALILNQIADIGDNTVDTVHVIAGESDAAVHDQNITAVFVDGHVFADFVQTAQRDNFQFFCHKCSFN